MSNLPEGIEKNRPQLSVVIPASNEEKNIAPLIKIILREKVDCEIIVCDNNSRPEDKTAEIVASFNNPNIKYIKANPGIGPARNSGSDIAQGEYICYLDADTRFAPGFLQDALLRMKYQGFDAAAFDFEPATDKLVDKIMLEIFNLAQNTVAGTSQSFCLGAGMIMKRDFGLRFVDRVCEDVAWARTAAQKGKFGIINVPGIKFCMRRMEGKRFNTALIYVKNAVHIALTHQPHPEMVSLYDKSFDEVPYAKRE